jgi:hypothetical protein
MTFGLGFLLALDELVLDLLVREEFEDPDGIPKTELKP